MSQDAPTAAHSAFLASTDLCDADHPSIEKLALSLCETGDSPQDKAVKVYHHVRDEVRFRISQFADKASDTLASGWGHCYQKANLEAALLRSLGIPAGFIMQQIAPEVMTPFFAGEAMAFFGDPLWHIYAAVYLDGRWLAADATFDGPLMDHVLSDSWPIARRWDGQGEIKLAAHLLLGDPTPPMPAVWGGGGPPMPGPVPEEALQMVNARLVAFRAEMG